MHRKLRSNRYRSKELQQAAYRNATTVHAIADFHQIHYLVYLLPLLELICSHRCLALITTIIIDIISVIKFTILNIIPRMIKRSVYERKISVEHHNSCLHPAVGPCSQLQMQNHSKPH